MPEHEPDPAATPDGYQELWERDLRAKWLVVTLATALGVLVLPWISSTSVMAAVNLGGAVLAMALAAPRVPAGRRGAIQLRWTRSMWSWAALWAATILFALGQVGYHLLMPETRPFSSAWHFSFLLAMPLLVIGLVLLPARRLSPLRRGRTILDSLLTVAAPAVIAYYFIIGPLILRYGGTPDGVPITAAYPVLDLALLFCVMMVTARETGQVVRRVLLPLTIGLILLSVVDVLSAWRVVVGSYTAAGMLNLGWPVAFMLVGIGARTQWLLAGQPDDPAAPFVEAEERVDYISLWRALLPYALIVPVGALILYIARVNMSGPLEYAVHVGAVGTLLLVLLRQVVAILDYANLNRRLRDAFDDLDTSHQSLAATLTTLQESETRFRDMADAAPVMIASITEDLRLDWASAAWARFSGWPQEDLTNLDWRDWIHPDDMPAIIQAMQVALEQRNTYHVEFRCRRADGQYRWLLTTGSARTKGARRCGIISCTVDITERREVEEQLRRSEQRFRIAAESSGDLIYDWDIPTGRLEWFGKFAQRLGYGADELPETIDSWEQVIFSEDRDAVVAELNRHLRQGTPFNIEYRVTTKSGEMLHWVDRGACLRDGRKTPVRMVGAITDITDIRRAETAMQTAKTEAEDANAAKSLFLANMSHEIRTPMTAILGYADLMLDPDQSADARRNHLLLLRKNGEHLLTLINDILDISKIEAGRMSIETIACSPFQVINDVAAILRPRAQEKGLTLDVEVRGALPEAIQTDPTRLRQILMNLLSNAIKFTPRGGVRLCAGMCEPHDPNNPRMQFDVHDTGIGLSPQQQGQLFQPFVQADSSVTRRFGGTGLGLAISKKLAEMLGGDISVASEPGMGSTFSVTIATGRLDKVMRVLAPSVSAVADAAVKPRKQMRLTGRVLVAEDGPDNQRIIRHFLRKAGVEVDLVENGRLAVERAMAMRREGRPYHLILMDMQMPEMDGYSATRHLRSVGYDGGIVALTAHAMGDDREKCLAAGCDDFASKPIEQATLLEIVARYVTQDDPDDTAPDAEPDLVDAELLNGFLSRLPNRVEAIEHALRKRDYATMSRLAHQLKGAAAGYGLRPLGEAAAALERSSSGQVGLESIRQQVDALCDLCRAAVSTPTA